jgi:TonB family protein
MKNRIYSSLLAMLLLNLCINVTYAQDEKLYDHISLETPPTYPGGIQKFYDFLGSTIKYPKAAFENNVQGTMYVTFIVEKDGSLTNLKREGRALGSGTDEEAIRSISLSKKWNPGMIAGKPVRVQYNVPVKFTIPNKTPKPVATVIGKTPAKPNKDGVYDHVSMETPPSYPGGIAKFYEFLGKNMSYPKTAAENKVKGTVFVTFNIEKDGSVSDAKTEGRTLGAGTDEEAIRVIKLSKKWNPGIIEGKPVRVKYNVPVKFTM